MSRISRHTELGLRWLGCGARLFLRNPWLLGGMGASCAAVVTLLWAIPLLGGPLIGFVAPIALASFYLAIDGISKLNMPLPAELRVPAMQQSPRELLAVFRDEKRIGPMVVVSFFAVFATLLTNILVWIVAGSAWTKPWTALGVIGALSVAAAIVLGLILYYLLAAALVYALARTFLREKPLIPEIGRSFRAGMHYVFGLTLVLGVLLLPLLVAVITAFVSVWLAYLVAIFAYALALPIVACSLYCSYRTVFQPRPPAAAHA